MIFYFGREKSTSPRSYLRGNNRKSTGDANIALPPLKDAEQEQKVRMGEHTLSDVTTDRLDDAVIIGDKPED